MWLFSYESKLVMAINHGGIRHEEYSNNRGSTSPNYREFAQLYCQTTGQYNSDEIHTDKQMVY